MCADNQKLGRYRVTGIPPRPAGKESFDIRCTYDLNGILEVEVTISSTRKTKTLVIERAPGRLTPEQVRAACEAMARLKLHPRDALPNTTALARGEALFIELTGEARELLGHSMAILRAALESQDEEKIRSMRERLVALTASLKS
jgi:molecular chaperone HscC